MTRLTHFTNDELNTIEVAFTIALDNTRLGDLHRRIEKLAEEVSGEKRYREKIKKETPEKNEEIERHRTLKNELERLAMNSNYGVVTRSCDDDEKLVVLCMINKQLKDICETLEGMQETLARVDDKI